MINAGLTVAHCGTSSASQACWTDESLLGQALDRDDLLILRDRICGRCRNASHAVDKHGAGATLRNPAANFVPVRPGCSRSTQRSGVSGSTSISLVRRYRQSSHEHDPIVSEENDGGHRRIRV